MTDLERELARQIHELSKELVVLRERVAVVESRTMAWGTVPVPQSPSIPQYVVPPWIVTCEGAKS